MAIKNIPLFKVFMAPDASKEVSKVLSSGYIGQGPKVDEFEKALETHLGVSNLVTTNSCTSALHLALHLLRKSSEDWPGISPTDEVLATPLTCTASNWPILGNGLDIKWVDVDQGTLNMDLEDLRDKITETTKVILAVHWGGVPIDLEKLDAICEEAKERIGFKPKVIEDCAHAFGTLYKGKSLGSHGNICCYSFQAIKHITSVDGGALVLPNDELYSRAKLVRWYGIDRESERTDFRCEEDIKEFGFKFHMNDVSATVGLANLKHAKGICNAYRENAEYYYKNLNGIVDMQEYDPVYASPAFWLMTLHVEDRDKFMTTMKTYGIATSKVHERNDKHSCVEEYKVELPGLEGAVKTMVCIPCGWWVTPMERKFIADCIIKETTCISNQE
jgi:dTDP-4-amino-4,6-dideoxygalactose transaminase